MDLGKISKSCTYHHWTIAENLKNDYILVIRKINNIFNLDNIIL